MTYIDLPAADLLDRFAAGAPVPGVGCAAALAGSLAASLTRTYADLTARKGGRGYHPSDKMDAVQSTRQRLEHLGTWLNGALEEDAAVYAQVREALEQLGSSALIPAQREPILASLERHLQRATDLPLEIAEACLEIAHLALDLLDWGYDRANGTAGLAASLALSGTEGCLFAVYLNIRELEDHGWAAARQHRVGRIQRQLSASRKRLDSCLTRESEGALGHDATTAETAAVGAHRTGTKHGDAEGDIGLRDAAR